MTPGLETGDRELKTFQKLKIAKWRNEMGCISLLVSLQECSITRRDVRPSNLTERIFA